MNIPILVYIFLCQTKTGYLIKRTNVFTLHLTFQTHSSWTFHESQAGGIFSHGFFSSVNNRSQLHGFHAPLRRLRVSFVFKVQNLINKNEAVLGPGLAFQEHLSPKASKETQKWKIIVTRRLKPKTRWGLYKMLKIQVQDWVFWLYFKLCIKKHEQSRERSRIWGETAMTTNDKEKAELLNFC